MTDAETAAQLRKLATPMYLFAMANVAAVVALDATEVTSSAFFWLAFAACIAMQQSIRRLASRSAVQRLFDAQQLANLERDGFGRMCGECNAWQPVRAYHCSKTGTCLVRFDHFCSLVAAPIAQANHVLFVAAAWLHTAFLAVASAVSGGLLLSLASGRLPGWSWLAVAHLVCVWAGCQLFCLVIGIIGVVELVGVSSNQLYIELLYREKLPLFKRLPDDAKPFDRGFWNNWADFLSTATSRPRVYKLGSL